MNPLLLPFISVITGAIGLTISKAFFKRYHTLTTREFNWLIFAAIVGVLILLVPFFGEWPLVFSNRVIWLLVVAGILGVGGNQLYMWGVSHEKISEIEPFLLFNPLVAIVIASLFYADERSWLIYIAAFIASIVLGWSHIKRHHLSFTWGILAILGFTLIYGFEAIVAKELLRELSPIMLYFSRCLIILVGFSVFVKPNFSLIKKHHLAPFGILGGLSVASVIAAYGAFNALGLSYTIFVFILSPIVVYFLSVIFLGDHWKPKNIIASIIIIVLVIVVNLIK